MPQVRKYDYQFHGGPSGYQNSRAILRLYGANDDTLAYVHFLLTGMTIAADTNTPQWMRMYMPEAMLSSVMEMLREEKPVRVYFAAGSGFLHTGKEPIGEAE